ncbi:ataxin-1-like isoform X1 [Limulus polyphemus]|uniref:Ataxin-1-like isoform X1 n=1 Tax=Limulus polyphemus TaxID=6850 RepID=A0ABM1BBN6_LIMPO|nr:ataxin-1-like isoform X1 [Limulus polyphemus]
MSAGSTLNVMVPYPGLPKRECPSNSLNCVFSPSQPIYPTRLCRPISQGPADLLRDAYFPVRPYFLPSLALYSQVASRPVLVSEPTHSLAPADDKIISTSPGIRSGYCNDRPTCQEEKDGSLIIVSREKKEEITPGDNQNKNRETNKSSSSLEPNRLSKARSYSDSTIPCGWWTPQMNGPDRVAMTGSANPGTDDLNWLTNVATGCQNHSSSPSQPSVVLLPEPPGLPTSLIHSSSGSLFRPPVSLESDLNSQRLYSSQFPFPAHHTSLHSPSLSGTSMYNQGSQLTSFGNLYPTYPNSAPSLVSQHFFSSESYPVVLPISGSHVPSRPEHPVVQSHATLALSHSVSVPSHLTQARHNYVPTASPPEQHGSIVQARSHYLTEPSHSPEMKHFRDRLSSQSSPVLRREDEHIPLKINSGQEVQSQLPGCPLTEFGTKQMPFDHDPTRGLPLGTSYKVPTGKEGSLKHRILRPPNINIIEPPASALHGAPLSAPPTHGPRDELPSPKQPRLGTPVPRSSLSSLSPHAAHQLVPPKPNVTSNVSSPSCDPTLQQANSSTSRLHYPVYFRKGAIIQLADGQLKQVEKLTTEDFIESASRSADLRIDSSTVVKIEEVVSSGSVILGFCVGNSQVQVSVEAPMEHPFFVFQQGWSSCFPEQSLHRYGLVCQQLKIGDVCISLTQKSTPDLLLSSNELSSPATSATCTVPNSLACNSVETSASVSVKEDLLSSFNCRISSVSCKEPPCATTTVTFSRHSPLVATTSTTLQPQRKRRWSAPDIRSEAKQCGL